MSSAWNWFVHGAVAAKEAALDYANVDTVKLAVTGLSGAGKTAFLVSVISNLLAMAQDKNAVDSLPRLRQALTDPDGQLRLLDVKVESAGLARIPRFPYEAFRKTLAQAEAPSWPPGTDKPAQIVLRLVLKPRSTLGQLKGAIAGPRVVRLELLDYPGEWLLDLPLLEQSYEEWSVETLSNLQHPSRSTFAEEFRTFLATLSPRARADDKIAELGFELYRDVLRRCRNEAELRWLQPGRFLMPGPLGDVPLYQFFPWSTTKAPFPGTLAAQVRDRFDAYKKEVRESFFAPYFRAFDRQVVLVDVLGALFAGKAAYEDTREALGRIGSSYVKLLSGGWLSGKKIKHVAFVATKADYTDEIQRSHLASMLKSLVDSAPGATGTALGRSFHFVSSIRCTTDDNAPGANGIVERVVMGTKLGEDYQRAFTPGVVPAGDVPPVFWTKPFFVMPKLRPPLLQPGDASPIEHINLDTLLTELIGDAL